MKKLALATLFVLSSQVSAWEPVVPPGIHGPAAKAMYASEQMLLMGGFYLSPAPPPRVEDITTTQFNSSTPTAHQVTMPATVLADDLLITIFVNDGGGSTVTTPSGWTSLFSTNNGTVDNGVRLSSYYKFAVGDEDSTTVNFVTSAGQQAVAKVYRISGSDPATAPVAGTAATGTDVSPNPSSLTVAWPIESTLWFAVAGSDRGAGNGTFTDYPSAFTDGTTGSSGGSGTGSVRMGSSQRVFRGTTLNPGVFTYTESEEWVSNTIAVRPAPLADGPLHPDPDPDPGGGGGPLDLTCDVTAIDGNDATVDAMLDAATPGVESDPNVFCIPEGDWFWDQAVSNTMPAYTMILCEDPAFDDAEGGPGTCNINDSFPGPANAAWTINTNSTGYFRLAGFRFRRGATTAIKSVANIFFPGNSKQVRVDHNTFDMAGYSGNARALRFGGWQNGVFDNNYCWAFQCLDIRFDNGGGLDWGDYHWSIPTGFGGSDFLFAEDNTFEWSTELGHVLDCVGGGKWVLRYNNTTKASGQSHSLGSSNRQRACRAYEMYRNEIVRTSGTIAPDASDLNDGTGIFVDNYVPATGADGVKHFFDVHVKRRNGDTYNMSAQPNGWGYCGPTPVTGTVDVVGTAVTHASGTLFSTSWPANSMIIIQNVGSRKIASVADTTHLTLTATAGTPAAGRTYWIGSTWDENAGALDGSRCMDAIGNGPGDLLAGATIATTTNTALGGQVWPRQTLEPMYALKNFFQVPTGSGGSYLTSSAGTRLRANEHYYIENSSFAGAQAAAGNITTGTGYGTIALRPTSCTTGTAYWATDEGEWDVTDGEGTVFEHDNGEDSPNGADGKMYVCASTNTWTARWGGGPDNTTGLPYIYPHPLRTNMGVPE